jgi:hypothetical protein
MPGVVGCLKRHLETSKIMNYILALPNESDFGLCDSNLAIVKRPAWGMREYEKYDCAWE